LRATSGASGGRCPIAVRFATRRDGDFDFVVRTLRARRPTSVCGDRLGERAAKWLGEHPGQTDIAAAAWFRPVRPRRGMRHLGLVPPAST
jgi:hypothetical protein